MPLYRRSASCAVFALAMSAAPFAFAQDAATVVATVNGTKITLGQVIAMKQALPAQYQQLPDEALFNGIVGQLVSQEVLASEFSGELPIRARLGLENQERIARADAMIATITAEAPDEAAIEAAYESQFGSFEPQTEYHAAHILVETEEEALALIAELEGGADFATLAREKSTGPSGPNGGDLGWFGRGQMVAPFDEAVAGMEVGGISAPVQTQFGWHVISLQETRETQPPAIEEVRASIIEELNQQRVQTAIEELRAAADIEEMTDGIDPSAIRKDELLEVTE